MSQDRGDADHHEARLAGTPAGSGTAETTGAKASDQGPSTEAPPPPHVRSLFERLRAYFLAGILVAAPLGITLSIVSWAIDVIDNRLIPARYNPNQFLPLPIPGTGVVLVVVALTAIGWATSSFLGRFVHRTGERVLDRIPVVRNVYSAFKQIFEAVLARRSNAFREVALIEYPRKGVWSIGFLTGATTGEVQGRTQPDVVNVFLPTTPNPTSGYLLFVPRSDVVVLDMTIEDGIKMVVSGGIVTPPYPSERPPGRSRAT
jgi:uncharacterized membrane protein